MFACTLADYVARVPAAVSAGDSAAAGGSAAAAAVAVAAATSASVGGSAAASAPRRDAEAVPPRKHPRSPSPPSHSVARRRVDAVTSHAEPALTDACAAGGTGAASAAPVPAPQSPARAVPLTRVHVSPVKHGGDSIATLGTLAMRALGLRLDFNKNELYVEDEVVEEC